MGDWPGLLQEPSTTVITPGSTVSPALGIAFGTGTGFNLTAWPAANRAIYVPFQIDTPMRVAQVGWENGATITSNADVGIYDMSLTKLASTGSTAQSGATAFQAASLTSAIMLNPGNYWLAMAASTATGIYRAGAGSAVYYQAAGVQQQATAFTLPTTAVFANPASNYCPFVVLGGTLV